eukprot:gene2982-5773_t
MEHVNLIKGKAVLQLIRMQPKAQIIRNDPMFLEASGTKLGFRHTTWKRRFFRLTATHLRYYKSNKSSLLKGAIILTPYCLVSVALFTQYDVLTLRSMKECHPGETFSFNSCASGKQKQSKIKRNCGLKLFAPEEDRTYYIHFATSDIRDTWLVAIANNLELIRNQPDVIEDMISHLLDVPRHELDIDAIGRTKHMLRNRFNLQMELNTGDPLMKCFLCLLDEDIPHLADLFSPEIANQQVTSSVEIVSDSVKELSSDVLITYSDVPIQIYSLLNSAALGKYRATHWLLSHGADPNITNKHGDTALIIAARLNLVPIVRLLLEYGADPTIANKFNETAKSETLDGMTAMRDVLENFRASYLKSHCTALEEAKKTIDSARASVQAVIVDSTA